MSKPYALITGASAGIGRELARLAAKDGLGLVLVARRRAELDQLAAELGRAHGVECLVVPADLADPRAAADIAEAVRAAEIDLELVVNNAGFGSNGPFTEQELARELGMIQVNVTSLVELTHRLLPSMLARRRGAVLNVGSTAGFQPGPFMATYYATKAFVNSFTEALAFELKGTGVTATLSCPGATATEFAQIAGNDRSALFQMGGVADAPTVAREAYEAARAGRAVVIHGLKNKAGVQALRLSPRAVVTALAAKLNRAKEG